MLAAILECIEKAIGDLEGQIADAHARSDMNRLLARFPGVGKLIASVITASTPDPNVFRSGRDFAAWSQLDKVTRDGLANLNTFIVQTSGQDQT